MFMYARSNSWKLSLVVLLSAVFCLSSHAQLSTASLFGTVTDSTGAVIPHATLTITQTDTNFSRTFTTKDDGSYREQFLPIGPYKISVSATGFRTLNRSGIVLTVMQGRPHLDLVLETGTATETITVSSDVPLVNLASSTLGDTVSNTEIDNLPLVNRDVTRLLQLVPGVQSYQTINNLGYQEIKVLANGSTDGFVGQVSYYLDGGLNMTGLRNSGNQIPDPDAVSQFNVVTNNYSAQLGRYSSAVVSVVTKSGTNTYHGSAFEFFRDRNFNAIGHNTGVGATKTPYNQHRFGATVGGPIRHDKDFFFASYAGYRFIQYTDYSGSFPSAAQMTGNFFENLPTAAEQASCTTTPSSAANTNVHFLVCNPATKTPYANNTLPSVDPTAVNIMALTTERRIFRRSNRPIPAIPRYTYRTRGPSPEQNDSTSSRRITNSPNRTA